MYLSSPKRKLINSEYSMFKNNVLKSLKEISKGRTTIAIAHRLSTIRNADLILVLDDGMIIETGTHDELVSLNSNYKYLWDLQTGKLENN